MGNENMREGMRLAPVVGLVKQNICFRECAKIIKIAEETGCHISITAGSRKGTTDSLLSLVQLGLTPGRTVVLSATGQAPELAFRDCLKVLDGGAAAA
ncbi:MAG: HPr family phosphocarrier protein [Selenomonadaceae bacterium]|nr:HPr family phosphocarrier protein [Selenomonadaceae bacterium]